MPVMIQGDVDHMVGQELQQRKSVQLKGGRLELAKGGIQVRLRNLSNKILKIREGSPLEHLPKNGVGGW